MIFKQAGLYTDILQPANSILQSCPSTELSVITDYLGLNVDRYNNLQ